MTDLHSAAFIRQIHPHLWSDPDSVPAITITPTVSGVLSIDDTTLTVALGTDAPQSFVLSDYSIASLIAALPAALTPVAADASMQQVRATALEPFDAYVIQAAISYDLGAVTAVLWQVLRPVVYAMQRVQQEIAGIVQQTDLRLATGSWLDLWGELWGVARQAAERDADYRLRIVHDIALPRVGNSQLATLLAQTYQQPATVIDATRGQFVLNDPQAKIGPDVSDPDGVGVLGPTTAYGQFFVTLRDPGVTPGDITALIDAAKSSGSGYTLTLIASPRATLGFDAIQATSGDAA